MFMAHHSIDIFLSTAQVSPVRSMRILLTTFLISLLAPRRHRMNRVLDPAWPNEGGTMLLCNTVTLHKCTMIIIAAANAVFLYTLCATAAVSS